MIDECGDGAKRAVMASVGKGTVYLTFDDGPYPATAEVLDVLRDKKVKATFFLCAKNLAGNGELQYALLKRMIAEGHSLGNHGYDHDPMTKKGYKASTTDAVKKDFTDNGAKLTELFQKHKAAFPGFPVSRLPGDGRTFSEYVLMITRDLKSPHASWDFELADNGRMRHVSYMDWQGVKGVAATARGLPKTGDILLLHDLHWKGKGDRLGALVDKLKASFTVAPLVPVPSGHGSVRYQQ
jgi:peptidoglycan/xylan/chitin deacetylase (PgdA/CDA1 family)